MLAKDPSLKIDSSGQVVETFATAANLALVVQMSVIITAPITFVTTVLGEIPEVD